MGAAVRKIRRSEKLLWSALLALLWAPRLRAACDPPGEPWIAIQFAAGLDTAFTRAVLADVRAGSAESDVCPISAGHREPPHAVIGIERSGAQSVNVNVDVSERARETHVSRNVELAGVPRDSRAFAVALAVNELLRADGVAPGPAAPAPSAIEEDAPLAPSPPLERGPAPPVARHSDLWRLSIGAAAERFQGGQTQLGADGSVLVPVYDPVSVRFAMGARQGLQTAAPHGRVRSRALSFMSDLNVIVWKTPVEIGLDLGAHGEWIELSGLTTDANTSASKFSGLALYVRTGAAAALHIAPRVWLETAAHFGVPLRGLEATDSGEIATGASGLQLSVSGGVSIEL